MKFVIDISDDGFSATKDGEVIAESRSGNDLLAVLNQVCAVVGAKVVFEESK